MVIRRQCAFQLPNGKQCRMAPLKNGEFCWVHSPERIREVQEARRLGGLRRKRESTITSAYQFGSLNSMAGILRLLQIAVTDALALDNGVARDRILVAIVLAALRVREVGNIEDRVAALEQLAQSKNDDRLISGKKLLLSSGNNDRK